MRPAALAALGVLAYLVFLGATLPASVVAQRLAMPGVRTSDVQGTVWHGSARAEVAAAGAAFAIEDLRWDWQPRALLAGRLGWRIAAQGAGLRARGEVQRGLLALEGRDIAIAGDAAALGAFSPLLGTWRPEGALDVQAPALAWDGSALRGTARIEWRGAAVALSAVRPLGAYRIDARAEGGPANFEVTTLDGPLRIAGRGTLTPLGRLAFSGEARADAAAASALAPLLDLFGPRRPDGAHSVRLGG